MSRIVGVLLLLGLAACPSEPANGTDLATAPDMAQVGPAPDLLPAGPSCVLGQSTINNCTL